MRILLTVGALSACILCPIIDLMEAVKKTVEMDMPIKPVFYLYRRG